MRREEREKAVIKLYQNQIYKDIKLDETLEYDDSFSSTLIKGVLDNEEKIINLINKYLKDWDFDRLGKVDQAIFKVAVFELINKETDYKVVINEAVELAKKYSDDKVKNMINGVLDNLYHKELK